VLSVVAAGLLGFAASAAPAYRHSAKGCDLTSTQRTLVVLDGNLFGDVQQRTRYLFGWSDKPVLDPLESVRLKRLLGITGTAEHIFELPSLPGGEFDDEGSYSNLTVRCPGQYTASFVTRERGFARFLLQQTRFSVQRSFCMHTQFLPKGARVSTQFAIPLKSRPPRFTVDINNDGHVDRSGSFNVGGSHFPDFIDC